MIPLIHMLWQPLILQRMHVIIQHRELAFQISRPDFTAPLLSLTENRSRPAAPCTLERMGNGWFETVTIKGHLKGCRLPSSTRVLPTQ